MGYGRFHPVSETAWKRHIRDTLFQPRQEGLRNALQDPVRHNERNIVEVCKISQKVEHWQFHVHKHLKTSNIIVKIHNVLFGGLVFSSYLWSMNKDEIIALLQQQISLLQEQVSFLQEQLQGANRKADALLEEVASLKNLLEQKSAEKSKQHKNL